MSYHNCNHCLQQLNGIEAIDYFLALHLCQSTEEADEGLLFHLLLALSWAQRQGHSCLRLSQVADHVLWQHFDSESVETGYAFPELSVIEACLAPWDFSPSANQPLVISCGCLYTRRMWLFEYELAQDLAKRSQLTILNGSQQQATALLLHQMFSFSEPDEIDWQKVAVANSLNRGFSLISGGPGTGKTYTVSRLLAAYLNLQHAGVKILMAAPTGKAAQRMSESIVAAKLQMRKAGIKTDLLDNIPEQAVTLHRLLGIRPQRLQLKHDKEHPLDCDLLLLDEASMIDLAMMVRIVRALPAGAQLVLLGDVDQLPSVEAGSLLAELACKPHPGFDSQSAQQIYDLTGATVSVAADARYSHLSLLTKSRRFGGQIGELAQAVIAGRSKQSWQRLSANKSDNDFVYASERELQLLDVQHFDAHLMALSRYFYAPIAQSSSVDQAFNCLNRFRILLATRQGERGVAQVNLQIEQALASNNRAIQPQQHYAGRPIMVTENNYATQLFNGDVGIIWPDEDGQLRAWFEQADAAPRSISLARLPAVESVYAMTIHKTQGSEFSEVALMLPERAADWLSPELIYTGLTRAKQHLYVVSSELVWRQALAKRQQRWSGLAEQLQQQRLSLHA